MFSSAQSKTFEIVCLRTLSIVRQKAQRAETNVFLPWREGFHEGHFAVPRSQTAIRVLRPAALAPQSTAERAHSTTRLLRTACTCLQAHKKVKKKRVKAAQTAAACHNSMSSQEHVTASIMRDHKKSNKRRCPNGDQALSSAAPSSP